VDSWERMKRQLQEFYQAAAGKTDELARVGARRIDLLTLKRQMSREAVALGSRVYEMIEKEGRTDVAADPEIARRIGAVKVLEQEIARRELEIEEIRAATDRGGARAAGRSAPNGTRSDGGHEDGEISGA
jgi:hypothetical protein